MNPVIFYRIKHPISNIEALPPISLKDNYKQKEDQIEGTDINIDERVKVNNEIQFTIRPTKIDMSYIKKIKNLDPNTTKLLE